MHTRVTSTSPNWSVINSYFIVISLQRENLNLNFTPDTSHLSPLSEQDLVKESYYCPRYEYFWYCWASSLLFLFLKKALSFSAIPFPRNVFSTLHSASPIPTPTILHCHLPGTFTPICLSSPPPFWILPFSSFSSVLLPPATTTNVVSLPSSFSLFLRVCLEFQKHFNQTLQVTLSNSLSKMSISKFQKQCIKSQLVSKHFRVG